MFLLHHVRAAILLIENSVAIFDFDSKFTEQKGEKEELLLRVKIVLITITYSFDSFFFIFEI